MTNETWQRLQIIVDEALDLDPEEREAYLERACADDQSLAEQARELIAADAQDSHFLEVAVASRAASVIRDGMPDTIGRYRIVRILGHGGMGLVYEAEQDQPKRRVALKVVRPGLATPELLLRFEQEQQFLGRLRHPGICHIYEAGTAEAGYGPQPYFAMELISGKPLLEYSAIHNLDLPAKLTLMTRICEAVEHAHQKGIIHRDLKPGNILVDDTGQPKILDFGVARVTDSDTRATRQTDVGQLIGTLAYMSPEQMLADPLELDTRSDVYALGVIFYELLTGRLPYKVEGRALPEAVRAVQQEEPDPLRSINTMFRGDIETISAKALEKDRARRYASAASFGGDLERYLKNEPIEARPPSTVYQLQKFARRNKALVFGFAAVLLTLSIGIVLSAREAVKAAREAATAAAISNFLQNDLLAQASATVQASANTKPDPDLKVRTVLDRAAAGIAGKFDHQPVVEAAVRQTIATTYLDLGLFAQAQKQLTRALELRKTALGEEHPDTLKTMDALAYSYRLEGAYARSEELYRDVVDRRKRVLGENHPDTLKSMNDLGVLYLYRDKYHEAEELHARVWQLRRSLLGDRHRDTLLSMSNLALAYMNEGKSAQAVELFRQCAALQQQTLGKNHPDLQRTLNHLGTAYYNLGQFTEAAATYSQVVDIRKQTLGPEHPDTLVAMNNLANVYLDRGDVDQAEQMDRHILEVLRKKFGDEHPDTLRSLINLAVVNRARGNYAEAESLARQVITVRKRVLGPEHPNTLWAIDCLGRIQLGRGDYRGAEQTYTDVVSSRRRVLGPQHPRTLDSVEFLADTLLREGKFAEAEARAREVISGLGKPRPESWQLFWATALVGASLVGQKKSTEAEPLLASADEGLRRYQATMAAEDQTLLRRAHEWATESASKTLPKKVASR
ncbi:MAG TPA: serine/threonine-protein kinase [Bryobacteraceae bacterium]